MAWEIQTDKKAQKELKRIPNEDQTRIVSAIREFISNPYAGDVQKMEGEQNAWRRRVGNYRIFYEILKSEQIVYVYKIKRRTSKTY